MFCAFITDGRYGWAKACEEAFGQFPVQVCHGWNTADHVAEFEGRPGRRALTYDELQELFDAADDRVEQTRKRHRKGVLAAWRDAVMLKQVYAYGTRRRETSMLDLSDLRHNPRAKDYGRFGALEVRFGKASRGSPPKRRTVLTVPEADWIVSVLEEWVDEVRPGFSPGGHPALWVTGVPAGHAATAAAVDGHARRAVRDPGLLASGSHPDPGGPPTGRETYSVGRHGRSGRRPASEAGARPAPGRPVTGRSAPPPEWTELAGRITAFLPELPAPEAARIVVGMTPAARTRIRDHLRLHPDALVSGASDAPRSTQALITSLEGAGITGVKAPSCLRCGRVRPLRRAVPGGRVCLGCEGVLAARGNTGPCCVCGETRPRPSNQRCASCQRAHISATRSCSTCGKPAALDPCTSCRPRPPPGARCARRMLPSARVGRSARSASPATARPALTPAHARSAKTSEC